MPVTINAEQRLFVIPCGDDGYSCYGFDNCYRAACELAKMLNQPAPKPEEIGTIKQHEEYMGLAAQYSQRPDLNSQTWFDPGTLPAVKGFLESARTTRSKLILELGDSETGRLWGDVETGYIGRSMGPMRAPLLLDTHKSAGGGAILTACILRITNAKTKKVLWCHPKLNS